MKSTEYKRYYHAGDTGVYVTFDGHNDADALLLSRQLGQRMSSLGGDAGIVDVTPGLRNLLIHYDPIQTSFVDVTAQVDNILPELSVANSGISRHWQIPVLYGGEAGPDLDNVAVQTGLSVEEVIALHSASSLSVAIMGFLPGLAYMKGVPEALYLPRKLTPRAHVPARSVGIAMDQTVVYPLNSPGGWNLIGRTPVRPFDASRDAPVLFRPGDIVSFVAIDAKTYDVMDADAARGVLKLDMTEGKKA